MELQNTGKKVFEISALSLYAFLSKKLSEWQEIKISNFSNDIVNKNVELKNNVKLTKAIYIQTIRFTLNICLMFYAFNRMPQLHKNANLIKILIAIYALYGYIVDIKKQCEEFLNCIWSLKQKASIAENKKGVSSCPICFENFYNCNQCLQTYHINCLNEHCVKNNSNNSSSCPNCRLTIEANEIENIRRIYEEENKDLENKENSQHKEPAKERKCSIQ